MNKALDYGKLKGLLNEVDNWPTMYMFKFIVPMEPAKLQEVEALFDSTAEISLRESKKMTYVSITAKQMMQSPDTVIGIYKKAEKIEKIMAL